MFEPAPTIIRNDAPDRKAVAPMRSFNMLISARASGPAGDPTHAHQRLELVTLKVRTTVARDHQPITVRAAARQAVKATTSLAPGIDWWSAVISAPPAKF